MDAASRSVALLVLAAGTSSRMRGPDKLLEKVDSGPLLNHVARVAIATGNPVFVTLQMGSSPRRDSLTKLDILTIDVEDAETGMASSLRAWANSENTRFDGVMVILADMPDVTTDDLCRLLLAFNQSDGETVIRATDTTGRPGHPVLFPRRLVARFGDLAGDQGARALLNNEDVEFVTFPDRHATTDLDTPEDWKAWRNRLRGRDHI